MSVSEVLLTELATRKWSGNQLAREAGLRPSVVSDILTGVSADPRISTVGKLLAALGKKWSWLDKKT